MDQFIAEVEAYAARHGIRPEQVLRLAINSNWAKWQAWKAGTSQALPRTQEKVRKWMEGNG